MQPTVATSGANDIVVSTGVASIDGRNKGSGVPRDEHGLIPVLNIINGEHFAGAERVQQLLGKRLGHCGFAAHFAAIKPGKFRQHCELRGHQVFDEPMQGRFDLSVVNRLAARVRAHGYRILHAHTPRTAMVTALLAKKTGLPWVYHVHSPAARDSTRGMINRINAWIESRSLRRCDALITVSKSLRREMLSAGVPRQRISVVPNGVPALEPIDLGARMDRQLWRLGMIALFRPRKGVEVALRAMRELQSKKVSVELELIGGFETEGYENQVRALAKELDVESSVRWTGFTNDVPSALQRLDGMLLPSLFGEGMPMVVLEAISSAVPVIGTYVEGTPEVIRNGVEGMLAEPGSAESLTKSILDFTASRERWQEMSQAAFTRHRAQFSDVKMAEGVARAYRKLLARTAD